MPQSELSGTDPDLAWQPLAEDDLGTVAAIAARLHPSLPERTIVFAEKLRLFPDGCRRLVWSAAMSQDTKPEGAMPEGAMPEGAMQGYALSHPWTLARPPKLDRLLGALPEPADCLFLHDVAVLPAARGRGAAGALLAHITAVAVTRRLSALALIAAYGSDRLWRRFGFEDVPAGAMTEEGRASLAGYGADVRYLRRAL